MKTFFKVMAILSVIGTVILFFTSIPYLRTQLALYYWIIIISCIIECVFWFCLTSLAAKNEENEEEIIKLKSDNRKLQENLKKITQYVSENRTAINELLENNKTEKSDEN